MKRIYITAIVVIALFLIYSSPLFAENLSYGTGTDQIHLYQQLQD